ncbi:MAG: secretin N-terminal domain-containing protein [bacterium]
MTAKDSLLPARRGSSYKVKVAQAEDVQGGGRRNPQQAEQPKGEKSGVQKETRNRRVDKKAKSSGKGTGKEQGKEKEKEEESHSVFKPYRPQEEQQSKPAASPDGMPEGIRQKVISSGEEPGSEEYEVDLNFVDTPIEEVLFAISKAINLDFIMGAGVKGGQINMRTTKSIPKSEFFRVLQSALEVNGLTLVPSGRHYKVVYAKEASQYPLEVLSGKGGEALPPEESFITQIIPLDYIPVKDMINILQPFLSKSAPRPIQHEDLNLLIINDTALNMKRLLKFVQELDKPIYQPKEKVFVYYVENGDAKKLASTLSSIYKKGGTKKDAWTPPLTPQTPPGAAKGPNQPAAVQQPPFGFPSYPPAEGGEVQGDVTIVAAEDINALIITTSPRNWEAVKETIKKLDIQPKQALIEVLVAEISIDDVKDFGLDWSLAGSATGGVTYRLGQDLGGIKQDDKGNMSYGTGINYMLNKQDRFLSLINSKVNEDKLNVLSSPHILASDNQEASIEITQDYPIKRETYDSASNHSNITYDYKTAGIKLNFTPKINEKGLVSLKLKQEVSQLVQGPKEGSNDERYIFSTRKAETSVVVHDGETLVIGGLIKEHKSKGRSGIPFLGDIPVLGYLFSHTKDEIHKTELIILITPHVIENEEEGRELTRQFQERVKGLKSKIDQGQASSGAAQPMGAAR